MTHVSMHRLLSITAAVAAVSGGVIGARTASASTSGAPPMGYQAGDRAPNFGAADQTGTERSLYDFRGQYVLLDFSAMWCGPSNAMASEENQLRDDINAAGYPFTYVTMLMESNVGNATTQVNAEQWAGHYGLTEPILQLDGAQVTASRQYAQLANYDGATGAAFPTLVLIDPNGRILEVHAGQQSVQDIEAFFPPRAA